MVRYIVEEIKGAWSVVDYGEMVGKPVAYFDGRFGGPEAEKAAAGSLADTLNLGNSAINELCAISRKGE